jgi:hypothetical protein
LQSAAATRRLGNEESHMVTWISTYGNIVYFFVQLIYWIGILILLAYAVAQYKRWVNFQLGTGRSGALRQDASSGEGEAEGSEVSVEEFVE